MMNPWLPVVVLYSLLQALFIGPESDHWLCLSLTHPLTHSCLVNLMAMNDTYKLLDDVATATESCPQLGKVVILFTTTKSAL